MTPQDIFALFAQVFIQFIQTNGMLTNLSGSSSSQL